VSILWEERKARNFSKKFRQRNKNLGSSTHNYTKFGQTISRNIVEIIATRCHILRLKCTRFDSSWGSAQTPLGKLTELPQTLYLDLRKWSMECIEREKQGKEKIITIIINIFNVA